MPATPTTPKPGDDGNPKWYPTYTPAESEMRNAWIYMQYAESIAGVEIAKVQADNFFAAPSQTMTAPKPEDDKREALIRAARKQAPFYMKPDVPGVAEILLACADQIERDTPRAALTLPAPEGMQVSQDAIYRVLDPMPWLDPMPKHDEREVRWATAYRIGRIFYDFAPRPQFSQNIDDYQTGGE